MVPCLCGEQRIERSGWNLLSGVAEASEVGSAFA